MLFIDHQTQLADFFVCALDELLSTEARVDGHEEHHVQVAEDVLKHADRGMWVEHHACVYAEGFDLLDGAVDMGASLVVEGDDVGACLGEGLEVFLRLHDHQVDVEGLLGFLLDGLHHGDAKGDVGHEAAVHHVAVEPVGLAISMSASRLRKSAESREGAIKFIVVQLIVVSCSAKVENIFER